VRETTNIFKHPWSTVNKSKARVAEGRGASNTGKHKEINGQKKESYMGAPINSDIRSRRGVKYFAVSSLKRHRAIGKLGERLECLREKRLS